MKFLQTFLSLNNSISLELRIICKRILPEYIIYIVDSLIMNDVASKWSEAAENFQSLSFDCSFKFGAKSIVP